MANTRRTNTKLSAVEAEATNQDFEFEHNGKTYTLPPATKIPFGVVRKMRKEDESEGVFLILEALADDEALAAIDEMSMDEVGQLVTDWQEFSGTAAGK